jgi:hemerythrin-like domain-containing protein
VTTVTTADAVEVQLIEQEHRRVRAGLSSLDEAIARGHELGREDAIDRVVKTLAWLRRDLYPHAAWEEGWLYPQLDSIAGTPWATRALRFEHEQIRELATELERTFVAAEKHWTSVESLHLILAMTRLATLVSAHLAQEQWFVEPLLDRAAVRH